MAVHKNLLLCAGELTGAYLITSSGEGESEQYARDLLRRAVCDTHIGCGVCQGCVKFDAGEHVDVFSVDGSAKKAELDRLDGFLSMRPMQGRHLVYITNAQSMSPAVGNSILKALEDRSAEALFILTTPNVSGVLATIVSRCMTVRLPATSRTEVLKLLGDGVGARVAAALSGGHISHAKAVLQDEDYLALRQDVLGVCEDISAGNANPIVLAGKISVHGDIGRVLDIMWMYFSDVFRVKLGCDTELFTPDKADNIKKCAESFTYGRIYNIIKCIAGCSAYKNRNARLAYEQTLLGIAEVK